jgi:adenine-specific DNA methylase
MSSAEQTSLIFEQVTAPHQRSFIEVQFPIAKLSAESYKERKAGSGQTLTGLGKWWGRKPLVLVRAIVLGLLMPASTDPKRDMETFLALMTMDEDGLKRRKNKSLSAKEIALLLKDKLPVGVIQSGRTVAWTTGVSRDQRAHWQDVAFDRLTYEQKLAFCLRPEEIDGPTPEAWQRINEHLGTSATSLPELVRELGERRYGHVPTVGDAFCGGGSIPFEAARLGCDVYASDINPVAGLLTWAALNIVGGGEEVVAEVRKAQQEVYDDVARQVDEWGIERNEEGWIAEAYLYCNEVRDPRTGWLVPLAPSWVIATRNNVVAQLVPDRESKRFDIDILEGVSAESLRQAAAEGTWSNGVRSPVNRAGDPLRVHERTSTSVEQLRGAGGLRRWTNDDIVPRPEDVFQERLYCIRWKDPKTGERHYCAPTAEDLTREQRVLELLQERFADWQEQGFIPSREIEPGNKTEEPIRTRGWTHWHHLFNSRQLLLNGLLNSQSIQGVSTKEVLVALQISVGRAANWNSRLTQWDPTTSGKQTFYNQAINPIFNYSCRPLATLKNISNRPIVATQSHGLASVLLSDARQINRPNDIWVTDPGYGDIVSYDEVSEFFLAWYEKRLTGMFSDWYTDSRRALNINGEGERFRHGLTGAYSNLTKQMSDDGYQVIMFTHQDASVWADVGLTIWAAGLQVVTAWTIATETPSTGVKGGGNYVQGTVCLILRKRTGKSFAYLSDISPEVEDEVKRQIESMRTIDDDADPSFGDADLQLAAYAAALRVLTSYSEIGDIDIQRELGRTRKKGEKSPITLLIEQAVDIATNAMVPRHLDAAIWRRLTPDERLYLKGIETEAGNERREGIYHELARSYGATGADQLYASTQANATRFRSPSEFRGRGVAALSTPGFAGSFLRRVLKAVFETAEHEEGDPRPARQTLSVDFGVAYWQERDRMIALLRFLRLHSENLDHWQADNKAIDDLIASLESHRL